MSKFYIKIHFWQAVLTLTVVVCSIAVGQTVPYTSKLPDGTVLEIGRIYKDKERKWDTEGTFARLKAKTGEVCDMRMDGEVIVITLTNFQVQSWRMGNPDKLVRIEIKKEK